MQFAGLTIANLKNLSEQQHQEEAAVQNKPT